MSRELSITLEDARTVMAMNIGGVLTFKPRRGGNDRYRCNQLPKIGKGGLNKKERTTIQKKITILIRQLAQGNREASHTPPPVAERW